VEEDSEEETQEPATLWDVRLDVGEFIRDTFCYENDVTIADDMEDNSLLKTVEGRGL
jgi:hypothetical protein